MRVTIINCFDTYEYRVELLYNHFISNGYEVKVIQSNFRHFQKVVRNEKKDGFIFIKVKPYYRNLSFTRLKSHAEFARNAFKEIRYYNPDLIWVLLPPNSLAKEANQYKKTHPHTKIIFDVIDMWPETLPISKLKNLFPFNLWRKLRDKNMNNADHIVTECNLFKERLKNMVPAEKMTTIYLAREIKPYMGIKKSIKDNIGICYLGSINNIIDIPQIISIIRSIDKKVTLHIIGDGEKKDELIENARLVGAEVIYHGAVFDKLKKQKIFNECHYGLNIMKKSVFVGLTMKSIDYFEAGLPLINNISGDTWEIVEKEGIGINLEENNCISNEYYNEINKISEDTRKVFEKYFSVSSFEKAVDCVMDKCFLRGKSEEEMY